MTVDGLETLGLAVTLDGSTADQLDRDVFLVFHRWANGRRDTTERTSTPVVVLHGFSGSGLTMASLAMSLGAGRTGPTGRTVLLPDLPHHGRTDVGPPSSAPMSMPETVALLRLWLDRLDIAECDLVGYSMGARTALSLAVAHPTVVKSLVLISGTPGLADEAERAARRAADDDLANRIVKHGIDWFGQYWNSLPLFGDNPPALDAAMARVLADELASANPIELAKSLRGMGTGQMPPLHDGLRKLSRRAMPVLLVVGEYDFKYRGLASRLADDLPGAQTVVIDGAAHRAHLDDPAGVADAVRAFWATPSEKS